MSTCLSRLLSFVRAGSLLAGLAAPAWAQFRDVEWICIERIEEVPRWDSKLPIAVGCEVVDCCPGCPGEGMLEWSIDVNGPDLGAIELRLEGFNAADLMKLRSAEGMDRDGPERLLVPTGARDARLSGMPLRSRGRPPVVWPSLVLDRERTRRFLAMHARSAPGDGLGAIELEVRQHFGGWLVSRYHLTFRLVPCRVRAAPIDRNDIVRLHGNTAGDDAVVLLDGGRLGACGNDEIWRGASDIGVGMVTASTSCNAEVAVFSDDNAVALQAVSWTNGPDLIDVALQPLIVVPIKIWLMKATFSTRYGVEAAEKVAATHVLEANELYHNGHAGVVFEATYVDLSANAAAVALVGTADYKLDQPPWVAALVASDYFTPGMINVYYVSESSAQGRNSVVNRNIVMVSGSSSEPTTLAHEFGHAFSLSHMNDQGNSHYRNVMWTGTDYQEVLTEGQCFRINLEPTSVLNTNGHRIGPMRSCPHDANDAFCPKVTLDAIPN